MNGTRFGVNDLTGRTRISSPSRKTLLVAVELVSKQIVGLFCFDREAELGCFLNPLETDLRNRSTEVTFEITRAGVLLRKGHSKAR
jgi:hypothetical protein